MKPPLTDRRNWLPGIVWLWLTIGVAFSAEIGTVASEYKIKAALIYNLTKFTTWPSNSFTSANAPIVVGILGSDPFGKTMDDAMAGEICDGRLIKLERLNKDEDALRCQILFISKSEKGRLKSILSVVRDHPILTISETEGFGRLGGMVNFVAMDNTIRFEINADSAQQADLTISSKLLNLPKVIKVATGKP